VRAAVMPSSSVSDSGGSSSSSHIMSRRSDIVTAANVTCSASK
jgi:hypothetical protein